jgi:hypothetical protein
MTDPQSLPFDDLARHVDQLRDRISHQPAEVRDLLAETLDAITEFNRRGLAAVIEVLRADPRGEELLYDAVDVPEVMALLVSHKLVRTDATLDVLRVVESIRPYLVASSIELDVERVEGDTAYVRFASGCSAPSQAEKDEITGVIRQRVPGLAAVVEVIDEPGQAFVSLDSLRIGPS